MNPLVGERAMWVIPLESILDDVEPANSLCRTFHFTPRKLVEGLVHEWFRYRLGTGPYQLHQIFRLNGQTAIEQIKELFLLDEDLIVRPRQVDDIEQIIDSVGHAVFNAIAHYVESFGVPIDEIERMDIVGWAYKSLVVRFL